MGGKRVFELDVLRGFAILLVMGVHVPAYPIWSTVGGWGVDLFFVLSGFLISNLLFGEYKATGHIRLARFFSRRALKLYPSFYLLLAVTLVYCFFWHVPISGREILGEATLTQNYIGAIWGHTWSLAVEEHFYIFLPVVLAFLMKRNSGAENPFRAIPYIFLAAALSCLALRFLNAAQHPVFGHRVHYEPSHLRMDSLFCGVFISYLHNFCPELLRKLMSDPWRFPIAAGSVLALAPALFLPSTDPIVYTVGFTLVYIAFGTMLLLSIYKETDKRRAAPGAALRGIAWMGTYSYTLYLWHVPLAQVFAGIASRYPTVNPYLLHAIYFATSLVAGVAASKLVEIPCLKLRERLFPRTVDGESSRLTSMLPVSEPQLS
jgi:peptidoglycan/LPS O-acetylase OafA/YrhL